MRPVVALFAGSRLPSDPKISAMAKAFGRKLGEEGFDIIYGGGTGGLMGLVAQAAMESGANAVAVVTRRYCDESQFANVAVSIVETEAERFDAFYTADRMVASIAFPGGPGSLREAMQGLERAVYDDGFPVILASIGSCVSHIQNYFDESLQLGFIRPEKKDALRSWNEDQSLRAVLSDRLSFLPENLTF